MKEVENKSEYFSVSDPKSFKIKMLNWSSRFNIFCFMDNNDYDFTTAAFDCMLAAGCINSITSGHHAAYEDIRAFATANPGWLFGHLNYPDKSRTPATAYTGFSSAFFFQPEVVIQVHGKRISVTSNTLDATTVYNEILEQPHIIACAVATRVDVRNQYSKGQYLEIIAALKHHIQQGDCYEINFCQDFFAANAVIDPLFLFQQLNLVSPNPFAAFYKVNHDYCLCASPERFIRRNGNTLISQPIKGTAKRNLKDEDLDTVIKNQLAVSRKEQSENVMIVDLVRNDMSKVCLEGSVAVKELFGIYSFPQVHQMISTVGGTVSHEMHWTDIMEACFPMGSMTGAPKKRVMELIDQYEIQPRKLFSGTIGYISPEGDFDFNVVIRSIFYNDAVNHLSFSAGGAITVNSDASDEYEESMLKTAAILKVLNP